MWTCPGCSRTFRSVNQSHSCATVELETHFRNKPPMIRALFDHLLKTVEGIGQTSMSVVKSAVFLKKESTYIEVKIKKDHLMIAFYLGHVVEEFPMVRHLELSKNKVAHVIHLYSPEDIDLQLIQWLRESYDLVI